MQITPTNPSVAKSAAKALREQLEHFLGQKVPLQKAQELYARSLGYANWLALSKAVSIPHDSVYLDDFPEDQREEERERIWARLSGALGFNSLHGPVVNAAMQAGLGYDIRGIAATKEQATPWGLACERVTIAPGIESVSTGSHGGYHLDEARRLHMDRLFEPARAARPDVQDEDDLDLDEQYVPEAGKEWYEEDCEAFLVEAAFPEHFDARRAKEGVRRFFPHLLPLLFGVTAKGYDDEQDRRLMEAFAQQPDAWFLVENLGPLTQLDGLRVGFYALTGRDALAWFTRQDEEASARGRYFVSPNYGANDEEELPEEGAAVPAAFEEFPALTVNAGYDGRLLEGDRQHTPEMFRWHRPTPSRRSADPIADLAEQLEESFHAEVERVSAPLHDPKRVALDQAQFVALVADRSDRGRAGLASWTIPFPDLRNRIQLWEVSHFEFFVQLRTVSGEPVTTLMANSLRELKESAIPELMKRVNAQSAACAAALAVRPELVPELEAELAKHRRVVNQGGPTQESSSTKRPIPLGTGYELYASGALAGKSLREAVRDRPGHYEAVLFADRSEDCRSMVEGLVKLAGGSAEIERWLDESGPGYFAAHIVRNQGARWWFSEGLDGLLLEALPDALGEAIDAGTPILLSSGINAGMQQLLQPALERLRAGKLPSEDDFPLAPAEKGEEIDPDLLQVLDKDLAWRMAMLLAYGTPEGDFILRGMAPKWHRDVRTRAFRGPDGGLRYIKHLNGGERLGMRVPAGAWRELTKGEKELVERAMGEMRKRRGVGA